VQWLAECIRQPREPSVVHSQRVILLPNMRGCNLVHVGRSPNNCLFAGHPQNPTT
jgi:hypothetical protein